MKIYLFVFSLFFFLMFNISYGQEYKELLDLTFNDQEILNKIRESFDIIKANKIYFIENKFVKSDQKTIDPVFVKNEKFLIENLAEYIFYIKRVIKDNRLAVIEIAYLKHGYIAIHFRKKAPDNEWRISDFSYSYDFARNNTDYVNLKNKIYHFGRDSNDSNILKIEQGMSKKEVNEIMKSTFYNRVVDSNEKLKENDTLGFYKYTTRKQNKSFNEIYFDKSGKVNRIKIAK